MPLTVNCFRALMLNFSDCTRLNIHFYIWGDNDVILSTTVTAAMLEVCYVAAV